MTINDIIAALGAHNWLLLVMLAALYARKLASADSKFPVTLSANVKPLIVGLASAVIVTVTAREGGSAWGSSLLVGAAGLVAGGFADGMLVAVCGNAANAPTWAKALVFLVDDVVGGGGGANAVKRVPPLPLLALVMILGVAGAGCNGANYPLLDKIEQVVAHDLSNGATDAQMDADVCAALGGSAQTDAVCAQIGMVEADVIKLLIQLGVLPGAAAERGKALLAARKVARLEAPVTEDEVRAALEVLQTAGVVTP